MFSNLKLYSCIVILMFVIYFVYSINNYFTIKAEHSIQKEIIDEIVLNREKENVILIEMELKGNLNEGNRDVYIKIMHNNGYISDDKFDVWLHEDEL